AGQSRAPARGSARCYQCAQREPRSPPTTGTTTGEQAARQEVVGGPSCGNQTRHCKGEGGEGITNVMKIVSMEFISDSEIPLRPIRRKWVFEPEEGVIDADGAVLCPTCRCCSLKQVPKLFPDLFGRPKEALVWVCSIG